MSWLFLQFWQSHTSVSQSIFIYKLIQSFNLSPLATWLAGDASQTMAQGQVLITSWGYTLILTGLAMSMAVNTLMTGLIVFKICKVFLEVKATSIERILGPLSSTGNPKLQHIIFIIIESGMALFAVQLVRVVLSSLTAALEAETPGLIIALNFVIPIHEMLNVIIRSVHFYFFCFTDNIYLAIRVSHRH